MTATFIQKGLIKIGRNRNAIIFQMQGFMDIGHGIISNLNLQVFLRTTPPFLPPHLFISMYFFSTSGDVCTFGFLSTLTNDHVAT